MTGSGWPDESRLRRIEKLAARSGPSPSLRSTPPASGSGGLPRPLGEVERSEGEGFLAPN
ncbi:hypothetical protein Poly41_20850 [Novipirellula artificiosorum]|uniref:Uncharacterized protein n=1 Tax=Novipirellula artificiosorum TaxID=2528016 RepID=A0A5C6DRI0_9BACT|nr:hypothetical protein Poly41_20850 [Novipirellula artificiosorum]